MTTSAQNAGDDAPLNPEQQSAVDHGDGPLVVLAGAGTGKTRVLTRRLVRLVQSGVPPWEILAVTFTNKAAGEMQARLVQLLGDDARTAWVGTFHATCARLLRRYGTCVGLRPGFSIYDEADQGRLVERLLRELGLREHVSARSVLARISRAKDRGADPAAATGHPLDDAVARVWPHYQAALAAESAVDFADLLLRTLDVLGTEPAMSQLAGKFSHVLVDEFQDTNLVQYSVVRRLSARTRNLTVVGDDDQAIYAWRGAEPANLLYFERDFPDARIVKLEQNYRSTRHVLASANAVIARNTARHDKTLWTRRPGGELPVVYRADDDRGEAAFVAAEVVRLVRERRCVAEDVAVLYRTNQQSRVIEESLRRVRVASRVVGGLSFYERREVADVLAYLRILANPRSDVSFERAVGAPPRGVGDATLGKLRTLARTLGQGLLHAARALGRGEHPQAEVGTVHRRRLAAFVEVLDGLARLAREGASVAQVVAQVVDHSGLNAYLEKDKAEGRERLGHLSELAAAAADYDDEMGVSAPSPALALGAASPVPVPWVDSSELVLDLLESPVRIAKEGAPETDTDPDLDARETSRVAGFLEQLALAQPGDANRDDRARGVQLMTVHVAKGLEWPIVFVTGLEDGLFPSLREREEGNADASVEEERRLMYVALTRARERLYLTHARTRRVWGEIRPCDPSRFLDEIPRAIRKIDR